MSLKYYKMKLIPATRITKSRQGNNATLHSLDTPLTLPFSLNGWAANNRRIWAMTPQERAPIIAKIIKRPAPVGTTYAELAALNRKKAILLELNRVRVKAGSEKS